MEISAGETLDESPDLPLGGRRFYEIPDRDVAEDEETKGPALFEYLRDNVVGKDASFSGPFGRRRVVYADYTASGRALSFLEKYIYQEVLPYYGNTHTTSTVTSLQSTLFRHEARDVIRNATNASEHDAVIFVSSGATGAVHKLINAVTKGRRSPAPLIIAGPWEHHSNLLPWREIGARVFNVSEDETGAVDLKDLKSKLLEARSLRSPGQLVVGCFSAASNVTGVIADVDAISVLLHRYESLAIFDYATAAPHLNIDINPVAKDPADQPFVHKDAVLVSPHKFVGGVDTPGVLIAKKALFSESPIPTEGGGGSVFFVTEKGHRYLKEPEMREEGGTPDIVGSIRAGLVFQLKSAISVSAIEAADKRLVEKALQAWKHLDNLHILGPHQQERLPVFSLMFEHRETGLFLHHNFVVALLNDLFGIQSRGGCACAGPYAQSIMGMDFDLATKYEMLLLEDQRLDRTHLRRYREYSQNEILRPGFVRLNLSFFASEEEIDFILDAVKWIAINGAKFLPFYVFNRETGEWRHKDHQVFRDRRWLGNVSYRTGRMSWVEPRVKDKGPLPDSHEECLNAADELLQRLPDAARRLRLGDQRDLFSTDVAGDFRWFVLPSEELEASLGNVAVKKTPPFYPKTYEGTRDSDVGNVDSHPSISPDNDESKDKSEESESKSAKPIIEEGTVVADGEFDSPLTDITLASNRDSGQNKSSPRDRDIKPSQSDTKVTDNEVNGVDGARLKFKSMSQVCSLGDSRPTNSCPCRPFKNPPRRRPVPDSVLTTPAKWFAPGKSLYKPTSEAIADFNMLRNGDRVLVCLSGGKDSLSLLHTLRQFRFAAKSRGVDFELGAVTVDPLSPSYDPSPLVPYLKSLGVPYYYEEQDILGQAEVCKPESICSFCSRMKRGRIYAAARREGYNVLAFGQHLDDLAESFLMSVFHNGLLRTMKANYLVAEQDLRVIRPFVYVREKDTRNFAEINKLPVIPENCPACFEAPKERHRFKQMLATQELLFPDVYSHILEAIRPLMALKLNSTKGFKERIFSVSDSEEQIV